MVSSFSLASEEAKEGKADDEAPPAAASQLQRPPAAAPLGGAVGSYQERRALRLGRKGELDSISTRRPGPDDADPVDVAAVTEARDNMGDYKLKQAADYKPRPGQARVDAPSKRRHIVALELMLHTLRRDFNARVLALQVGEGIDI